LAYRKEELLHGVGLPNVLGRVDFLLIVKQLTGFEIIPISRAHTPDKTSNILNGILRKFLKIFQFSTFTISYQIQESDLLSNN